MTDAAAAPTDLEHAMEVEAWRRERYERLRQRMSWLTLVGLDWLRPGENRIGTDPTNDVVLPAGAPTAGRLVVDRGTVTAVAEPGAGLAHEGQPVDRIGLVSDADAPPGIGPTLLELGRLRLCLIRRGDRLALRTWDTEAEALRRFAGIPHFPVSAAWRFDARFEPATGDTLAVPDVLGFVEEEPSAGSVAFERHDVEHRLQALPGGDAGELWLIFADATNGAETYAGGRYLYTAAPRGGRVVVDLNRAYNPPCVFTPYATCPLPWTSNRLPFRVEAGEMVPEPA
jgi:uncharacterized protein (DUF1684 family)